MTGSGGIHILVNSGSVPNHLTVHKIVASTLDEDCHIEFFRSGSANNNTSVYGPLAIPSGSVKEIGDVRDSLFEITGSNQLRLAVTGTLQSISLKFS